MSDELSGQECNQLKEDEDKHNEKDEHNRENEHNREDDHNEEDEQNEEYEHNKEDDDNEENDNNEEDEDNDDDDDDDDDMDRYDNGSAKEVYSEQIDGLYSDDAEIAYSGNIDDVDVYSDTSSSPEYVDVGYWYSCFTPLPSSGHPGRLVKRCRMSVKETEANESRSVSKRLCRAYQKGYNNRLCMAKLAYQRGVCARKYVTENDNCYILICVYLFVFI